MSWVILTRGNQENIPIHRKVSTRFTDNIVLLVAVTVLTATPSQDTTGHYFRNGKACA